MTTSPNTAPTSARMLAAVLAVGAIQGEWLYWLYKSTAASRGIAAWPASSPPWFLALLALGIFIPTAAEFLLIEKSRGRIAWISLGVFAAVIAALAAYQGVLMPENTNYDTWGRFPFWAAIAAMSFVSLPFLQTRLAANSWTNYGGLFRYSWQNAFFLAETALFTGVFWLLLLLWAQLFSLIDIRFFKDLFSEPAFAYPVTSIIFSAALRLVAARENITLTLRRHLHGVFLWLLPLVAFIAAFFLVVLPFQGLSYIGKAGISTGIMLWTIAFLIKFYNAAYQDGEAPPPYPPLLRNILRLAVLTLVALAALSIYGMSVRIGQHGWSVDRVWAAVTAALGVLYGLGYATAACRKEPWMHMIGKVNTWMALVLLGTLLLLLSPVLSPQLISANSQMTRLLHGRVKADSFDYDYLRFSLGKAGTDALAELVNNETHPEGELIRERAKVALAKKGRWDFGPDVEAADIGKRLVAVPAGTRIDPSFVEFLKVQLQAKRDLNIVPRCVTSTGERPCRVFVLDLDDDGVAEVFVDAGWDTVVYSKSKGEWKRIGHVNLTSCDKDINAMLDAGKLRAVAPRWKDLEIDGKRRQLDVGCGE